MVFITKNIFRLTENNPTLLPMNVAQIKCLAVFSVFAIIGFGPVSPGCLIGMYLVIMRPLWFRVLNHNLYGVPEGAAMNNPSRRALKTRIKCFFSLVGLFIVDIAPIPVTPIIAFGIILTRPQWFYRVVERVYDAD